MGGALSQEAPEARIGLSTSVGKLTQASTMLQASSATTPSAKEKAGNASLCSTSPSDPSFNLYLDTDQSWTADTGASAHMTPHRHWFQNYKPYRVPIELADGVFQWDG